MGEVTDYLRLWAQEVNRYGFSWILDALDWPLVERLENTAATNPLAEQLLSGLRDAADEVVHAFDYSHFMTVYDAYAEAKVALAFIDRHVQIERVPRRATRTPDFRVTLNGRNYYVEVKAFHARQGEPNYERMMENGFNALAQREDQLARGRPIAMSETVVRPHHDPGAASYDPRSPRWLTEQLVRRVGGRLHAEQFDMGDTLLAAELSLLPLFGSLDDSITRCYPDPHTDAATSGVLWHLAFGRDQMAMYRPEEFEGYGNLDGRLNAQGIMRAYDYIKGMLIFSRDGIAGVVLRQDETTILPLVTSLTDHHNNDVNDAACRLQPGSTRLREFVHMVQIKAFELWKDRRGVLWEDLTDWRMAKEALGIPEMASI
jgi:hypothetical protein